MQAYQENMERHFYQDLQVPVHGCVVGNVPSEVLSKLPCAWCNKDKCEYLELTKKNLCLKYQGPGKRNEDAAAARTLFPVPSCCALFYFEIKVVSAGRDGFIGIGLSAANVSLNRLPGWESNSLGYHGDDGNAFRDSGTGTPYGPTFTTGDVVGCCWNLMKGVVFFTKNGLALPIAFRNVAGILYPTVGLQTPGEIIEANFGAQDFIFDLVTYAKQEKLDLLSRMDSRQLFLEDNKLMNDILDYLVHQGYTRTAVSFSRDTHQGEWVNQELQKAVSRHSICNLISHGNIDDAMKEMEQAYPSVCHNKKVVFQLLCQKFVELIRKGRVDKAVELGKTQLMELATCENDPENASYLSEISSLLAYEDPTNSPASYLLDCSKREAVAQMLNDAFLQAEKCPRLSRLETLVRHLQVLFEKLAAIQDAEASLLSLQDFLIR
ncbi:hypothetical protein GpartN1_g396.t1 [Galdieria partita]|uniref:Uncharacterized protein n=1 Tax=Galdieria partita TaxID=83374 RepID=A0A9C7UMC1_9RHOD|nr:hypothetical protein GpartN1_g396.t1 [Galdieria partita]